MLLGYYDDGQSKSTRLCHLSCKSCTGPFKENCLSCFGLSSNRVTKPDSNNECTPMVNFYDDGVNEIAKPCSKYCQECIGPKDN